MGNQSWKATRRLAIAASRLSTLLRNDYYKHEDFVALDEELHNAALAYDAALTQGQRTRLLFAKHWEAE